MSFSPDTRLLLSGAAVALAGALGWAFVMEGVSGRAVQSIEDLEQRVTRLEQFVESEKVKP